MSSLQIAAPVLAALLGGVALRLYEHRAWLLAIVIAVAAIGHRQHSKPIARPRLKGLIINPGVRVAGRDTPRPREAAA